MCTRLLYTVLPSPYTQRSFHHLLAQLTRDLNSLQEPGVSVPLLHVVYFGRWNLQARPTFLIHSPVQIKLPRSNPYENLRLHGRRKSTTSGSLWLVSRVTGRSCIQLMLFLAVTTALTNVIDATFEKLDWMTQMDIVFNFRFCSSLLIQSTSTESPQGPIDPCSALATCASY